MSRALSISSVLVFILTFVPGCIVSTVNPPTTETCVPGESFEAADGCNTCECPSSGLLAEASCTAMVCDLCGDLACPPIPAECIDGVAHPAVETGTCDNGTGECVYESTQKSEDCAEAGLECVDGACVDPGDLCAGVECPGTEGYCEDNVAHSGEAPSECDPATGKCFPTSSGPPVDCDEWGGVCVDGACIDLCEEVSCPGSDAVCEDGVSYPGQGDGICDPATGECQYPPGLPPEDCAEFGLQCEDGVCVGDEDPCEGVSCPGSEASCEDGVAYPATSDGICEDGECLYPPGPAPQDCALDGLVCVDGECVAGGGSCGGFAGLLCDKGEICDITMCGADMMGTCVPEYDVCPKLWAPVCGCDGKTYPNDCERLLAGAALDYEGECGDELTCDAMDAFGEGPCDLFLGYRWNGENCEGTSGCSCEGLDCGLLFDDFDTCEKTYADCGAPIEAEPCMENDWPEDPFEVVEAAIEGDILYLTVKYGGGCKTHDFPVCYGEIIPAGIDKVDINIGHFADNDMCKALVYEPLEIDLTALKLEYLQLWGGVTGALHLTVTGWPELIFYEF